MLWPSKDARHLSRSLGGEYFIIRAKCSLILVGRQIQSFSFWLIPLPNDGPLKPEMAAGQSVPDPLVASQRPCPPILGFLFPTYCFASSAREDREKTRERKSKNPPHTRGLILVAFPHHCFTPCQNFHYIAHPPSYVNHPFPFRRTNAQFHKGVASAKKKAAAAFLLLTVLCLNVCIFL